MTPASTALRAAERMAARLDEWEVYTSSAVRRRAEVVAQSLNDSDAGRLCEFRVFAEGLRFVIRRKPRT